MKKLLMLAVLFIGISGWILTTTPFHKRRRLNRHDSSFRLDRRRSRSVGERAKDIPTLTPYFAPAGKTRKPPLLFVRVAGITRWRPTRVFITRSG